MDKENDIVEQNVDNYSIEVEMSDQTIEHMSRKQRFAYRCLSMFGPKKEHTYSIKRKKELMEHWIGKLFPPHEGFEAKIIFNETMWQPEDESSYGNRVRLQTRYKREHSYRISDIDFRTENHHLFNVKYKWY